MDDLRSVAASSCLLDVVAFRLFLGSIWGMSRRGRRDVEESNVRDDIPGSRNLGSRDYD
jgi:hypothetical protein